MANEVATIVELINGGEPLRFSCADAVQISKGSILYLNTDNPSTRTASKSHIALSGAYVAGICASEKVANDGSVYVSVYRHGIFDIKEGGGLGISAGKICIISGANNVSATIDDACNKGRVLGIALEDFGVSEVGQVLVNL